MYNFTHSVTLDKEKCKGCTNCIKGCPTQAIRVRDGKAKIISERCIDCGECIRVCPYHAKKAITDPFEIINNFKYKIALPAPALYAQFKKITNIDIILTGLKQIGFDDVFEVARGAEAVSVITRKLLETGELKKPVISSACPAIVRLISVRFPGLIDNLLPINAPMDVAAMLARKRAREQTGLEDKDIGVFFLTPCAAKATAIKQPIGQKKSLIDGAIAIRDVYLKLAPILPKIQVGEDLATATSLGVSWASSGGEAGALNIDQYIAADGIINCMKLLEEVDNEHISKAVFLELNSCVCGCAGGPLTLDNPFVSKCRIQALAKTRSGEIKSIDGIEAKNITWEAPVEYHPILNLDTDMMAAMKKLEDMNEIYDGLPQLDCGSCGSPGCRALAEDIVRGHATETDCIFKLRERVRNLANELLQLESHKPPLFENKDGV